MLTALVDKGAFGCNRFDYTLGGQYRLLLANEAQQGPVC
jgi:hypothetical protein